MAMARQSLLCRHSQALVPLVQAMRLFSSHLLRRLCEVRAHCQSFLRNLIGILSVWLPIRCTCHPRQPCDQLRFRLPVVSRHWDQIRQKAALRLGRRCRSGSTARLVLASLISNNDGASLRLRWMARHYYDTRPPWKCRLLCLRDQHLHRQYQHQASRKTS